MPDYKKLFRRKRPSRQIVRKITPFLLSILVIAAIFFTSRHFLFLLTIRFNVAIGTS